MMGGGDEGDPVEGWPPNTTANLDLTNKDGSSSRLLFLTVQYVGEPGASFNTGLDGLPSVDQRVVSPLDPNMGCTACYSPVYRPASPLITAPGNLSPVPGGYLNPTSPTSASGLPEPSMIVLDPQSAYSADGFVDDGKLLLLSAGDVTHATELVVAGADGEAGVGAEQRVEFLLSNGTIAYGYVEATESDGTKIIQMPREFLVAAQSQETDIIQGQTKRHETVKHDAILDETIVSDESSHLRALYNTLKEQGLIVEQSELDAPGMLSVPVLQVPPPPVTPSPQPRPPPLTAAPALAQPAPPLTHRRYWCEDCNKLLDDDCREHQVNRKIIDKAVPSRARATLPSVFLSINALPHVLYEEYGVFARKSIPKRTQFGPIEGVILKPGEILLSDDERPRLELTIETDTGQLRTVDVSNEHMSNWMRFVRMASSEQLPNLLVSQLGASLFFTTTRTIVPRQELLVWYSPAYALRRDLDPNPPPPVFPCESCGKKLRTYEQLKEHFSCHKIVEEQKRKTHEENLTVSTLKRKNQAVIASVEKDDSEHTKFEKGGVRLFECPVCRKRFPRSFSLKRHILLLHTRENKYHCKVCHLGFSHSFNRLRHMRRAHPTHKDTKARKNVHRYESWTCTHCSLTFACASLLNVHTLVHIKGEDVGDPDDPDEFDDVFGTRGLATCPQCSKSYSDRRKLADHVSEHGKLRDPSDKKFHCTHCGKNFISMVRFQVHSDAHAEEAQRPLQCHICLKRLRTQSALSCHLKIHNCCSQWECPMCKEHFGNLLALKSHVHTHVEEGLYHCPHCNKSFEEYCGVRKHIRAFHSALIYPCNDCGKRFATQDKLRMHLLKHSDHREFLCADCGKQFKRKDKLKEHMRRMHAANEQDERITGGQMVAVGGDRNGNAAAADRKASLSKIMMNTSDYERYIYKCHQCFLGFKRRGMLVNHLAARHPEVTPDSVPELNLPILKTTKDYYCQYCDKIYKSSSKRKAHILKIHPGFQLPMSNRQKGGIPEIPGLPNPTFSQTVGSITTEPQGCQWCHKQYASKAKLLQHQRKKHFTLMPQEEQDSNQIEKLQSPPKQIQKRPRPLRTLLTEGNMDNGASLNREREEEGEGEQTAVAMDEEEEEEGEPTPVALSTNINHLAINLAQLQDYEIITTDDDNGIIVDNFSSTKRSPYKNDCISSDLLSQAMSEIGVSMSDLRVLSSEQYLKLLQTPDGLYTPYPAR